MIIKILGAHNCESRGTRLASLLIDDCLALDAGGLTSSLSFPDQQRLKAILLTHQHYDHVKDVPLVAMNSYLAGAVVNIYSILPVYEALVAHLMDGKLYPNFLERPEGNPTIKFTIIEPYRAEEIEGYSVLAVPVSHSVASVGYQIAAPDGKAVFYTGDTGPGLADCWKHVSPQMLVIEVTAPSTYEPFARESGHLTPRLLQEELVVFRELKGYLPRVVVVHMNPQLEDEIRAEIAAAASALDGDIAIGYEGMQLQL